MGSSSDLASQSNYYDYLHSRRNQDGHLYLGNGNVVARPSAAREDNELPFDVNVESVPPSPINKKRKTQAEKEAAKFAEVIAQGERKCRAEEEKKKIQMDTNRINRLLAAKDTIVTAAKLGVEMPKDQIVCLTLAENS